jgi:DNA polymerase-4
MLNQLLVSMTEKLAYELRRQEKLTSCITVRIRYSDFDTHTLQQRIPYTAFDHVLISEAQSLFRRLWQRRMLIRLIGVRVSGLVRGVHQLNMFEDTPEMISLYMTMDTLRGRFGRSAIRRAAGVMTAAERSERELRKTTEMVTEKSRMEERMRGWRA